MPRTMWGIIYGIANPHDRQHILPDDDSELLTYPVNPGEKLITIPIVKGEDNATFVARMNEAICIDAGVSQLVDMRFAEVDQTGTVIQVHRGDAALYSGPNTYVNCPQTIAPGHTYDSSTQQFTIPSQTMQPKAGVRATAVTIPSQLVSPGCTVVVYIKSSAVL